MVRLRYGFNVFAIAVAVALCLGLGFAMAGVHTAFAADRVQVGTLSEVGEDSPATKYPIVYKLKGGTLKGEYPTTIKAGKTIEADKLPTPKRKGYTFAGWYSNKKLTKPAVEIAGSVKAAQRTVYAKWKTKEYSITYITRGGKLTDKRPTSYKTSKGVRKLPTPVRPGYLFVGWRIGSTKSDPTLGIPKGTTGNKKLYAAWKKHDFIAHQGIASEGVRKNSLDAFKNAADMGFHYVETDVRFTRDNVPVLSHNERMLVYKKGLDGKKKGKPFYIKIADVTYDKLQNNYIAAAKRGVYTNRTVITFNARTKQVATKKKRVRQNLTKFTAFLDTCKDEGIVPVIEMKEGTKSQINSLIRKVEKRHMVYKVKWSSFSKNLLNYVKDRHPKSSFIYLAKRATPAKVNAATKLMDGGGDVTIAAKSTRIGKTDIARCKKMNVPLGVFTLKNEKVAKRYDAYVGLFYISAVKKHI